jgi:hypothetical protein
MKKRNAVVIMAGCSHLAFFLTMEERMDNGSESQMIKRSI